MNKSRAHACLNDLYSLQSLVPCMFRLKQYFILHSSVSLLFRFIEQHPDDAKYRRVYKRRSKFKKLVWNVHSAKLFMAVSGWMEVNYLFDYNAVQHNTIQ